VQETAAEAVPAGSETVAAAPETETAAVAAPEAEYEPEEASASYRVDPIAPSEFRHSGFFETETVEAGTVEAGTIEVAASEDAAPELDTTGVPPPPPPFVAEPVAVETAAGHAVTSISETGEMYSEAELPAAVVAAESMEQETSPMLHETAIHQSFSPGQGALEEEILDEDETDPVALHAGYMEEYEDLEEETLEGAADLGTMLREMSIDQITAPADVEAEDEEFEEEEADEAEYGDAVAADSEEEFAEGDKPTHSTEDAEFFANTFREPSETEEGEARTGNETERRPRRDGRRDRGRGDRDRGRDRSRSTGGDHERSRSGGGGRRQSAQATNLPAISDLLKPGQEILVQIAKEPIAKKGARITSHIALPGRFLVFMPTVNHTGVSRKIESDGERRRLKEILLSEKGEASGGFIVRTAASGASEEELRSDLRFLLNLWADIKTRSESSKSPALIYHDLNLVERILRDQVTDTFSAIWVDTESEYERVLRFLQRFQPSLIRRVKLYTKETPLFEQFGITEEINKALRSKVWLKSGGSIVINQTEALVAIDINTGKFVGKTARLEDTIVKTNLDAIPEIVRQIRLRDLGGIIIIDFIDMDERRNRNKVMAALEEELKTDRAPSKVLQFNDFGLVAITRKRVKQSLERTLSTTCGVCQGTGMVKSPITVCNDIYIEMRKMHKHLDRGDVMLRVHPDVVKQLKLSGAKWLQEMEEMVGKTILIKSDPALHPEQFDIH
jgi:ribonuclease G